MERVVYIGGAELSSDVAAALSEAGFEVSRASDLADALDTLDRVAADCVLLASARAESELAQLRRRGHDQPAVALLSPEDPLPDDTEFAAVVSTANPERVATRIRDAIADRKLIETRRDRDRLRDTIDTVRDAIEPDPDAESVAELPRRLVDSGAYTTAWIGRHEPKTDVVVPVVAAGVESDHIRTLTASDAADPVVRSLAERVAHETTDETTTVTAHIGNGPFVLVCYRDRSTGVATAEREAFERLSDLPERPGPEPTEDDDANEGDPESPPRRVTDDGLRVLGDTFAHELANYLDVASTHLDLAGDDDHLQRAARALERMSDLADEARRLAGSELAPESITLSEVAADAWERLGETDAELVVSVDGRLEADRALLALLLENLFRNALEHGARDRQGSGVEGPDVVVTVEHTEGGFAVADDGPGIPEAERDRVFVWGDSSDGSGVGLGIVALIAQRHDWSVSVTESDVGGARFEFGERDGTTESDSGEPRHVFEAEDGTRYAID